jgi:hypothetical protein
LIAGVLLGLGLASKWAAAYTLGGVFVLAVGVTAFAYERGRPGTGGPLDLLAGRGRNAALLFGSFAVIPLAIYLASYIRWFGGPTAPYGWNLWELTQQMYWYHSSLTAPHCAGSPWWSWPLDLKPVYWYFGASTGGHQWLHLRRRQHRAVLGGASSGCAGHRARGPHAVLVARRALARDARAVRRMDPHLTRVVLLPLLHGASVLSALPRRDPRGDLGAATTGRC